MTAPTVDLTAEHWGMFQADVLFLQQYMVLTATGLLLFPVMLLSSLVMSLLLMLYCIEEQSSTGSQASCATSPDLISDLIFHLRLA